MPWRPSSWDAVPGRRFDPYRERAGRLFTDEGEAGFVFVRLSPAVAQIGGALWWRRWSEPFEQVEEYYWLADGGFADTVTDAGDLADEVRDWGSGRMSVAGETCRVEWLDDEKSRLVRDDVFRLGSSAG
ncbi:hypothetical protein QRX60_14950 [Amycolatopsis mongoliensis]|uniref:Uncharacterized protein n=1 Tax=Amycolatopsis mongoliensis TaxID=715475 RepID=A0A9Y2JUS8_9PSEU|nr:hypothetical protein [Amycolatopsis sp. 4-36]WIY05068.1 hypothetical protein QRX60_14950 [Amycolatopsis sp. 4-36]